ncbi:MAG: ribosome recycling factor [Patescibacteria group bacterium]
MPSIVDARAGAFEHAVQFFESDLQAVRTGRAQSGVVERIMVEAYGSMVDIKSVAAISVPDAKTIQIEPWDKSLVQAIEKAIIAADIGMQPNTAGTVIRLIVPQMTEENRHAIVKQVHEKAEQARISVRNIREEIREEIQKAEKEKAINEDEKFRLQESLDKHVKEYNEKIQAIADEKEKEIMTI